MPEGHDDRSTDPAGRRRPNLSPLVTGARGLCPRCGKSPMFQGFLALRPCCDACGLDYAFADPADGPAVFVQLFACVPGVIFVLLLAIVWDPAWWVYLMVGLPVVVATTVPPLRPIKGWLVASQFYFKAEEGRLVRPDPPST